MKIVTEFKNVPNNTRFYVPRLENGPEADSIGFFKKVGNVCDEIYGEWLAVEFPDDQMCCYYTED